VNGKAMVRAGYDAIAAEYLATRSDDSDDVRLLPELMTRLPAGARVLDAGCGAGVPVTKMLSEHFDVTGVDFSATQIRLARKAVPRAKVFCADIAALNFPDGSFDAICAYYSLIHIPREEHRAVLENFLRMLKPGGLVLATMGRGDTPASVEENWLGAPMYWSHFDAATNLHMFQAIGFQIIWSRVVADKLDVRAAHFFILASKHTRAN